MGDTLQKRIHSLIQQVFDAGDGAWLVWCDPRGEWLPLLRRVAGDKRLGGFTLVEVEERAAGAIGSPTVRRDLQARLDAGESFVLHVPVAANALGWLWAHALLAERIYARGLRGQLVEWGWRPSVLTMTDDQVAVIARTRIQQDPAEWESGGLQPDRERLLAVLAGQAVPDDDSAFVIQLAAEEAGLPPLPKPDDLASWRTQSLARLLVTQAHAALQQVAPAAVPDGHALLIAGDTGRAALGLLERWQDSVRLAQSLPAAVADADRMAALGGALAGITAEAGPFVSRAAEYAVFANTCARLAQASGKSLLEQLAASGKHLERHHVEGFWGHRMAAERAVWVPWGELQRLSAAAQELLEATPSAAWTTPQQAITWYEKGGWRMDRAGEQITRNLSAADPALVQLVAPLRAAFRARWEDSLIRWSELWTEAGCPILTKLPTAGAWLKAALAKARPTVVLVLDALRYDLGATLAERINQAEQVPRATLAACRAPLPSITALGMAQALPLEEEALVAELVDGKWQMRPVNSSENLANADQRRAWWSLNQKGVHLTSVAELNAAPHTIPKPGPDCLRLVIHDAAIDKLGHDDELEIQGSDELLKRYQTLVERLRDQAWLRILVVTDHGYIHWTSSEEKSVPPPLPKPLYAARRAAAYPAEAVLEGPRALSPGGGYQIAFPHGAASFRAYGGLGYFHGGASLQEWITPSLLVEWPVQAQPVQVSLQPMDRILSLKPKVSVEVLASSLIREDSIPRSIEVVVRHAKTRVILFESDPVTARPDHLVLELSLRVKPGAKAPRNTPVRVELRDPNTEDVLSAVDTKLLVELSEWPEG